MTAKGAGVHSFPDYVDLRDQSQSFSGMAAYTRTGGTLAQAEDAQCARRRRHHARDL